MHGRCEILLDSTLLADRIVLNIVKYNVEICKWQNLVRVGKNVEISKSRGIIIDVPLRQASANTQSSAEVNVKTSFTGSLQCIPLKSVSRCRCVCSGVCTGDVNIVSRSSGDTNSYSDDLLGCSRKSVGQETLSLGSDWIPEPGEQCHDRLGRASQHRTLFCGLTPLFMGEFTIIPLKTECGLNHI
ncbi:hypothetical protein RRG08_011240 [Elysia crispata]|uniref:Uncharacterized protein n=1 Tax=Elysia crispata TaxID=231223 RepID=A0AAE0YPI9_9GAST|nr:hypothetical protein RRG08_011240 [Elysia crispata]